jgi:hypothetical protein
MALIMEKKRARAEAQEAAGDPAGVPAAGGA